MRERTQHRAGRVFWIELEFRQLIPAIAEKPLLLPVARTSELGFPSRNEARSPDRRASHGEREHSRQAAQWLRVTPKRR
jgi:hypothetical protein